MRTRVAADVETERSKVTSAEPFAELEAVLATAVDVADAVPKEVCPGTNDKDEDRFAARCAA